MELRTRAEILTNKKRRRITVEIGDYGSITLRSLSSYEMSRLEQMVNGKTNTKIRQLLLCATIEDDAENLIFDLQDAFGGCFDEVDSLFVNMAYRAASLFTGFAQDGEDNDKIEAAVKNYKSAQSNGSPESAQHA